MGDNYSNLSVLLVWTMESPLRELFFNPFKIFLKIFSVVPIFAIRFHVYFLHQKHQSWVGFIRFCFSTFASHHWLVGDRRQFFPSLVVVFPPLVIVVFFSLIDLLSSAMIFGFWAKSIFDSIFKWSQQAANRLSWKCRTRRPLAQTKPF